MPKPSRFQDLVGTQLRWSQEQRSRCYLMADAEGISMNQWIRNRVDAEWEANHTGPAKPIMERLESMEKLGA